MKVTILLKQVVKLILFLFQIDIFVLIACPENSLLDSKDFYRPIVTPYEVELACNANREWSQHYILEFQHLLLGLYRLQFQWNYNSTRLCIMELESNVSVDSVCFPARKLIEPLGHILLGLSQIQSGWCFRVFFFFIVLYSEIPI